VAASESTHLRFSALVTLEYIVLSEQKSDEDWSRSVASIAITTLIAAGVLDTSQQKRATEIVAEEILVRLAIGDRPT
jgi:hypothetical protein